LSRAGRHRTPQEIQDRPQLRLKQMLSLNLRTIKDIHRALYRELVEWFGLPSRVAIDCYRDALANANDLEKVP